jgi:hypothetical protein
MTDEFDLTELKKETEPDNRYEKRIAELVAKGQETERIHTVVESAIENIQKNQNSFVIYGEPQSGKTEMMIALTARLLDFGFQIIIVLLNDSVQLLSQNLERFQRSGISPTPKKFSEILPSNIQIGKHKWVIFSKKNGKDLEKLYQKLSKYKQRVIIDDEADYATPNSKVNLRDKSKINELTGKLIGEKGVYIGVTATPARLDLNRTHDNLNDRWIDMRPHQNYTGQDIFFPSTYVISELKYKLTLLTDHGDYPSYLRNAIFSFLVSVAYLNTQVNVGKKKSENYSILIHTSGKKVDHSVDYNEVTKTLSALRDDTNSKHEKYYKEIWKIAKTRFGGHENGITRYIIENNERYHVVVMNSDKEKNAADNRTATSPSAPFTIIIGGNIVSRGVTFDNLLSMYFTRDVKHKLQQDTYVQRARMFGSRNNYVKYFELTIPKNLFLDWQRCFIFHRLSLESRRNGSGSPIWIEGKRVTATSGSSINRAHVVVDQGEMSFEIFVYNEDRIQQILGKEILSFEKLKEMSELLGKGALPTYLLDYIGNFSPDGDSSIAIHPPSKIYASADQEAIYRSKGFLGTNQLKKFPQAIHHVSVFYNNKGKARVFYKYNTRGDVRFLRVLG